MLDDAFASVDAAKEEEILTSLAPGVAGPHGPAHDPPAARRVARPSGIVVLEAGRVIETAGHDELVRAGGLYARLWRIQQLEEEIARA